jgi:hypothetical protein
MQYRELPMKIQKPITLVFLLSIAAFAQQAPATGARELYYFGAGGKDKLPPIQKASAPRQSAASAPQRKGAQAEAPAESAPAPVPEASAVHLGLRYNVILVDRTSGRSEPVDPDRTFKNGDCLAIEFDANRSGYLYVMAKQSSGNWIPLIPSPEMSNEVNQIDPGQKVRAPRGYCFEISDPPGAETLFVVLSRDPRDFYELYRGIKGDPASPPVGTPRPDAVQMASARMVNNAVAKMEKQFGTRDLVIRKVAQATDSRDIPNSVYVVNASDKPSSTVVTQLLIKHR